MSNETTNYFTLGNIATVIGLIILIGGYVVMYVQFQTRTEEMLKSHTEDNQRIYKLIETQSQTDLKTLDAVKSLNERLIRLEEREKMRERK